MSDATVPMHEETCCNCHMTFWIPKSFRNQCYEQRPHKSFWCPAGHQQHFMGESELDAERRKRQRLEQQNAQLVDEAVAAIKARDAAERARVISDRALKRHRVRAKAGLCPCCNRSFINMRRHIATQHPDYNVVELKKA